MSEKEKPSAKFINSIALASEDIDGTLKHFQITIVQEEESKKFRCFFDVVDPSTIHHPDK